MMIGLGLGLSLLLGYSEAHLLAADAGLDTNQGCRTGTEVWVGVIVGSLTIGLVGILPLFLISTDDVLLRQGKLTKTLRTMLGFACGGLLGNAYLHLLPEAYNLVYAQTSRGIELKFFGVVPITQSHHGANLDLYIGLWVIIGILTFIVLEKMVAAIGGGDDDDDDNVDSGVVDETTPPIITNSTPTPTPTPRGQCYSAICRSKGAQVDCASPACRADRVGPTASVDNNKLLKRRTSVGEMKVAPSGYLNLIVNSMDNFTHGLAVSGSFCVNTHVGIMTVLAIVIHEVPHEIGDYAILVRAGFNTRQAILSQLLTSAGGLFGGVFGMVASNAESRALWILPFTAGGFTYISLVSLVSDMNSQETPGYSWWRDVLHITGGIVLVGSTQLME